MTKRDKSRIFAGIILILLGISLSGLNIFLAFEGNTILILLGVLFIAWYFYSNSYGLLIPGCILAGIGLSSIGEHAFWSSPYNSTLGVGVGFIAVYLIDLLHNGKSHWWPLIPGGIITISALAQGALGLRHIFRSFWPVILIFLGLWIIAKSTGMIKNEDENNE